LKLDSRFCPAAIDSEGRTIWIVDPHRDHGKRLVVLADEMLAAFMGLESTICASDKIGVASRRDFSKIKRSDVKMKLHLLLGLLLSGLLCGCGSSGQGGSTTTPNSSHRTAPPPIAAHAAAHRG
jgi:hypothetical protein